MLFSYKKVDPGFDDRLDKPSLFDSVSVEDTKYSIYILGVFLCAFATVQVMAFLFKYIPSVFNETKLEYDEKSEKATSVIELMRLRAEMIAKFIWAMFSNPQLYYNLAYLILGLLGVEMHPLFFTYHLLTVIFRYQKLIDVLQAFWGPIAEIILTLLFFMIIEYVFTVIGYVYFADMYPDFTCHSLFSCFLITIDQTFKNNGGFATFLTPVFETNEEGEWAKFNVGRLLFDQMSNFILLILLVQILAGLIIDKFGEIREDSENMEEELKSNCVICGEKGDVIERKTGKTFEQHKEEVHNLWNYILFIGYLKRKPKKELNGIESWVYDLFKRENIGWLPYSLWEGKDEGAESEKINKKLKEIQDVLKGDTNNSSENKEEK